ncbi:undecaprenyldiphospho-muramoylpentapeptide beta-N-acetylglucosaminyltransferase [Aliidiomarina taiwanensis]|uniref:UDP-N-acetylglucosamine--N-acetylmuramyl-(pentapeptide) pyrophosphoryl-undecaprenol N-acetylglucosamine transferase n=1 Tax=Aliidiomarina taiwanensis TaxID=946228 RepID=A0A432X7Q5_9GAMM|nr:undecaprenyldiphospho-muramoylpentapeptide beta-N-acetylglucosaminyltransferase [Aliidiomarina taiwanensis]RUO42888.1 undecaprenyldiphospho-muramoylpentapeptide beta-N-acetylglucosaminyltransferase [Aliidiomarina taiwanensis]
MKHVLITAGGTGGHVFPALAVAQQLQAEGWQVSWLGTNNRMEADVVPKAGFSFIGVTQQGLRGRGFFGWLTAPFRLVGAVFTMRGHLTKLKPDLVLGFGGYTAGPAGVAAWSKGIPLIIHEQNAAAGLTNRLLARIANKVLLGFDAAQQQFKQSEYVGNPVRASIQALSQLPIKPPAHPLRVLVVGGSLGAAHLNQVVPTALAEWTDAPIQVWHQTGRGHLATVQAGYGDRPETKVTEFIDNMAEAYQQADLIICRAGALTCSELACVGRASILVPYPHAVDNHQLLNAKALEAVGAAIVIEQQQFTAARLAEELKRLVKAPADLQGMAENARKAAVTDATQAVVHRCNELVVGNK